MPKRDHYTLTLKLTPGEVECLRWTVGAALTWRTKGRFSLAPIIGRTRQLSSLLRKIVAELRRLEYGPYAPEAEAEREAASRAFAEAKAAGDSRETRDAIYRYNATMEQR